MNGGKFKIRNLKNSQEAFLSLRAYKEKYVSSFTIDDPNAYYIPQAQNFPCVDSWIPKVGFFQMTLSLNHPIKARGIAAMVWIF